MEERKQQLQNWFDIIVQESVCISGDKERSARLFRSTGSVGSGSIFISTCSTITELSKSSVEGAQNVQDCNENRKRTTVRQK